MIRRLNILLLICVAPLLHAALTVNEMLDSIDVFYMQGKYAEAIQMSEDGLMMVPDDSTERKSEFWSFLTVCYYRISDYEHALYYGELCLSFDETQDNKANLSNSLGNLAGIYASSNRQDVAIEYLNRAIELEKEMLQEDSTYSAKSLAVREAMLGEVLLANAKQLPTDQQTTLLNQALELTQDALNIDRKLGREKQVGSRLSQLANIHMQIGDTSLARLYNIEALNIARQTGNINTEIITLIQLERYEEATIIARQHNIKRQELFALKAQLQQTKAKADYRKTCEILERILTLQEEITTEDSERELTRAQVRYKSEQKEQQIRQQEQTIQEQQRQKRWLIFILSAMLLILVLIMIIAMLNIHRKRTIEELATLKDQQYTILSHDLRNPITAQQQVLRMLYSDFNNYSRDTVYNHIRQLLASSNAQVELLANLQELALMTQNRREVEPVRFDLSSLILEMKIALKSVADLKNITLDIKTRRTLVMANRDNIRTIIRNLASNAIKFSPEGAVVEIGTLPPDSFYVRDYGIGMPPERVAQLLNTEKTVTSTIGTAGENGTGIGLTICRNLLRMNNGTWTIESEPENGTTFVITLPIAQQ